MLRGMDVLKAIAAAHLPGMDAVLAAGGVDLDQLLALGLDPDLARKLQRAGRPYVGPCSNSKKREATVTQARANQLSMEALLLIEDYARRAEDVHKAWDIRLELSGLRNTRAIKAKGRELTAKLALNPEPGVKVTRRENGNRDLKITAPSDVIAELSKVATSPQALQEAVREGGVRTTFTTNLVLTPADLVAIEAGRGDEVRVRSTDGAWRSGAKVAEELSVESLRIILQTPAGVGINSYRLVPEEGAVDGGRDRHANAKQRVLAAVESPTCAMQGCNRPAESSQVHHLHAWSQGGARTRRTYVCCAPFTMGATMMGRTFSVTGEWRGSGAGWPGAHPLERWSFPATLHPRAPQSQSGSSAIHGWPRPKPVCRREIAIFGS